MREGPGSRTVRRHRCASIGELSTPASKHAGRPGVAGAIVNDDIDGTWLGPDAGASNAALKRAEEQVAAAISKWDEDAKFIDLAKKKLRASNKAYEQYRDAQCAFAYSLGGGAIGNALEMRRLTCRIELDIGRIKQLNTDMSALSTK